MDGQTDGHEDQYTPSHSVEQGYKNKCTTLEQNQQKPTCIKYIFSF